jgi:hypothetical protein
MCPFLPPIIDTNRSQSSFDPCVAHLLESWWRKSVLAQKGDQFSGPTPARFFVPVFNRSARFQAHNHPLNRRRPVAVEVVLLRKVPPVDRLVFADGFQPSHNGLGAARFQAVLGDSRFQPLPRRARA